MKLFNELKELVNNLQEEAEKYYGKGNQAAGVRLRKGLIQARNIATEAKKEAKPAERK